MSEDYTHGEVIVSVLELQGDTKICNDDRCWKTSRWIKLVDCVYKDGYLSGDSDWNACPNPVNGFRVESESQTRVNCIRKETRKPGWWPLYAAR